MILKISTYNQITVTIMLKAPVQPYLAGILLLIPCWTNVKSMIREYVAIRTAKIPITIPNGIPRNFMLLIPNIPGVIRLVSYLR